MENLKRKSPVSVQSDDFSHLNSYPGLAYSAWSVYKKGIGQVLHHTNPMDTARYTRSHMLRGLTHHVYAPAGCRRTGALVLSRSGRKPGEPSKGTSAAPRRWSVSWRPTPLPFREYAPCQRMEWPRNEYLCTMCRTEWQQKSSLRRRLGKSERNK